MNYLIIFISICVTILSVQLFRKAAGSMSLLKLNTVSYVFYFQIITSAIVGSVLLAIGKLDYHEYAQNLSVSTKIEAWAWVMYSLLSIPAGMLILNKFLDIKARVEFNKYLEKDVIIDGTPLGKKLVLLAMLVFSVGTLAYVLLNTKEIPLFTLLGGDAKLAAVERVEAKTQFQGIEYIRSFFGLIMMPVFTYFSYVLLRKKASFYNALMFGLLFLTTSLLLTYDVQKAPIAFFILGFWIVEVLISNGVSRNTLLIMVGVPVMLILIGYSLTTDKSISDQFLRINSAFYGRAFVSGYFAFPLSLEFFPDIITEQTYLSGIPTFLLEEQNTESARLLMMQMNPEGVKAGTANLFSGYFMGEAWANYGYIGLIISPLVVGMVIQSVHVFLLKQAKKPLVIAFYAMVSVRWLVGAGFVNFLFLKLIIFPVILYYLSRFVMNKIMVVE